MLYLIDVHWERRAPHPDKPQTGRSTYAIAARYLNRAITDAEKAFNHQYGANLQVTSVVEKKDPARIFTRTA